MSSSCLVVAVVLCGIGSVGRVWATRVMESRLPGGTPSATALVNVAGALALGAVAGVGGDAALLVLGTGLLGGFTTFSTWMVEVDAAARDGGRTQAVALLLVPAVAGVTAYAAARALV